MTYSALIAPEFGKATPIRDDYTMPLSINPKYPIRIKKGSELRMWDYAYKALKIDKYWKQYNCFDRKEKTIPYYDIINWKILDVLCFSGENIPTKNDINETYVLVKSRNKLVIVNIKNIYQ